MAKSSRRKSGQKLKALIRTQEINDLLSKSITESEALQNTGDDRPVYESHVTDLLGAESQEANKTRRKGNHSPKKSRSKRASKGKKKRR